MFVYSIELERVIDGDTIDVVIDLGFDIKLRERVRLYDVDTPELRGPERQAGLAAKAFTEKWLSEAGLWMHSRSYNARGKYGRVLGEIYRDGDLVSLNKALGDLK